MDATDKILYKEESFKIIGACMKVHRSLGAGFLEAVYEEALEKEFQVQEIPFKKQVKLELYYDNQKLNKHYRADFICYDSIILEIKAVQQIPIAFYAQLKNYLRCTKMELGMLINFGMTSLTYKRIINLKNSD
ncbi:GxxExxY protein [Flavobacterium sp. XN-5]|uniref:GxxExxY protein n=1 Tax=Flavobacterium sp. XN-5 TaxID=2599390 RepID=UPI0011C8FC4C|nr:GxxExxY protein [Flavobacterium sp. XN-5]NGY37430.1 GxxExxY protein [Flavobacterium sp. XN-5]